MIRVTMIPYKFGAYESGIKRVVESYKKYLPNYGVQIVDPTTGENYDLIASHAGMYVSADVLHCHGLYWTADYPKGLRWEWDVNAKIIATARQTRQITVPSNWVAETFARDMRILPHVVPHGIEWQEWQHNQPNEGYVLWNKNRDFDVCSPHHLSYLADAYPDIQFVSTFLPQMSRPNINKIGLTDHDTMKKYIQRSAVYLSTTKETFGIGVLEAMAAGIPVLGFAHGGNSDLVQHGVTGYLAAPNNEKDLIDGLAYCLRYRHVLGANAQMLVRDYTWETACEQVANIYKKCMFREVPSVTVVIPTYNYAHVVGRAIESVIDNEYRYLENIIVVDDGSNDDDATRKIVEEYAETDRRIRYVRQDNAGVANARNMGVSLSNSKYVCCLDADDQIAPGFLKLCCEALEEDRSLGIAYTGLTFVKPDGSTGLSPWPSDFNYNDQLRRRNQIPTCCVFRKEMWARLGGYKQRYAPHGAGAEDAEFWLRAGAYGYNAKKVAEAGLFIYSWQSGRVSGDKNYREEDWLAWHPWTKDKMHPFASIAEPSNLSHPVRQYDEPVISVIIPVGVGHHKSVIDALDSLEAQTFRKWEVIVVWDNPESYDHLKIAYPYVNWVNLIFHTRGFGAGYARNRGAEQARAPLLLFLDADDWLLPTALDDLLNEWNISGGIVYSDYYGKAYMTSEDAAKLDMHGRLIQYDEKLGEATILHQSKDYNCEEAIKQPDPQNMYIWNLITSLFPKTMHSDIGGFDESMKSWEDWDYWIRMARAGKCFYHLSKPLVVYRFATGERRETGLQQHRSLIEYLRKKYQRSKPMPCGGCGGNQVIVNQPIGTPNQQLQQMETPVTQSNDENFVLIQYNHPNRGQHRVLGPASGIDYGYRGGGDRFYVDNRDVTLMPELFSALQINQPAAAVPAASPPPAPTRIAEEKEAEKTQKPSAKRAAKKEEEKEEKEEEKVAQVSDFEDIASDNVLDYNVTMIPGVTPAMARQLNEKGYHTIQEALSLTKEEIFEINGVGPARGEAIMTYLASVKESLDKKSE